MIQIQAATFIFLVVAKLEAKNIDAPAMYESAINYPYELTMKYIHEVPPDDFVTETVAGEKLCETEVKVVRPEQMQNKNGDWQYIFDDESDLIPQFRVEICKNTKSLCQNKIHYQLNYEGFCKQRYIQRQIVKMDTEINNYKLASGCSCGIRKIY